MRRDAGKASFNAQVALGNGMVRLKETTDAGVASLGQFAGSLVQIGGWFGWLGTKVALFGGLLNIGLWHIMLDAIIETIAMFALAAIGVLALAAAVGIFVGAATLAQDTMGRISDRLKAIYTASTATGQAIYPMTDAFDKLASVLRPGGLAAVRGRAQPGRQPHGPDRPYRREDRGVSRSRSRPRSSSSSATRPSSRGSRTWSRRRVAMAEQFGRIFSQSGPGVPEFPQGA